MIMRAGFHSANWSGGHHVHHLRCSSTTGRQKAIYTYSGKRSFAATCNGGDGRTYSYGFRNDVIPGSDSGVSERRKLKVLEEFLK